VLSSIGKLSSCLTPAAFIPRKDYNRTPPAPTLPPTFSSDPAKLLSMLSRSPQVLFLAVDAACMRVCTRLPTAATSNPDACALTPDTHDELLAIEILPGNGPTVHCQSQPLSQASLVNGGKCTSAPQLEPTTGKQGPEVSAGQNAREASKDENDLAAAGSLCCSVTDLEASALDGGIHPSIDQQDDATGGGVAAGTAASTAKHVVSSGHRAPDLDDPATCKEAMHMHAADACVCPSPAATLLLTNRCAHAELAQAAHSRSTRPVTPLSVARSLGKPLGSMAAAWARRSLAGCATAAPALPWHCAAAGVAAPGPDFQENKGVTDGTSAGMAGKSAAARQGVVNGVVCPGRWDGDNSKVLGGAHISQPEGVAPHGDESDRSTPTTVAKLQDTGLLAQASRSEERGSANTSATAAVAPCGCEEARVRVEIASAGHGLKGQSANSSAAAVAAASCDRGEPRVGAECELPDYGLRDQSAEAYRSRGGSKLSSESPGYCSPDVPQHPKADRPTSVLPYDRYHVQGEGMQEGRKGGAAEHGVPSGRVSFSGRMQEGGGGGPAEHGLSSANSGVICSDSHLSVQEGGQGMPAPLVEAAFRLGTGRIRCVSGGAEVRASDLRWHVAGYSVSTGAPLPLQGEMGIAAARVTTGIDLDRIQSGLPLALETFSGVLRAKKSRSANPVDSGSVPTSSGITAGLAECSRRPHRLRAVSCESDPNCSCGSPLHLLPLLQSWSASAEVSQCVVLRLRYPPDKAALSHGVTPGNKTPFSYGDPNGELQATAKEAFVRLGPCRALVSCTVSETGLSCSDANAAQHMCSTPLSPQVLSLGTRAPAEETLLSLQPPCLRSDRPTTPLPPAVGSTAVDEPTPKANVLSGVCSVD
jgi:hypothetical protein